MKSDPNLPLLPLRASACPGLLRIVPALDGGLCRVRLACGQLTAAQALAAADAAQRCAADIIEITNRANLQLRGVRDESSGDLIRALLAAGLGPLTPAADEVRNLLVSPAFGIDIAQWLDTAPLAAGILDMLQTRPRLQRLAPKFSLSLDGGERCAMRGHPHDIWFTAIAADRFAFGFAGSPAHGEALGVIAVADLLEFVEAALHVFLDLAERHLDVAERHLDPAAPPQTRMRDLLQIVAPKELLAHICNRLTQKIAAAPAGWRPLRSPPLTHIGAHRQKQRDRYYIGAAPALGRLCAAQLRALARIANVFGDATLRLTPWQSVLLPNVARANCAAVLRELQGIGLHVRHDDPFAQLVACAGARGCAKGRADTKRDAHRLAGLLRHALPFAVHLSGCERSCAAAATLPFTLLATAAGRYDIYRRSDAPGLGTPIASDCDIETCARLIDDAILAHTENFHSLENNR